MRQDLLDFFNEHKDELVLVIFEVGRLIGIEEDDEDIYWKIKYTCNKIVPESCIIPLIILKDRITDVDYNSLNTVFELNN